MGRGIHAADVTFVLHTVGALRSRGARLSFYMECTKGDWGCLHRARAVLLVVSAGRSGALELFLHQSASSDNAHYE